MEGFVRGSKDCNIVGVRKSGHLIGGVQRTLEGCEVEGIDGVGDVGWWDEEGVDYLDNTAVEREILMPLLACSVPTAHKIKGSTERAYCLSQGTSASLSTDKNNHISSLLHVLHYLSSSDVGVCGARQKCRDENWRAGC